MIWKKLKNLLALGVFSAIAGAAGGLVAELAFMKWHMDDGFDEEDDECYCGCSCEEPEEEGSSDGDSEDHDDEIRDEQAGES